MGYKSTYNKTIKPIVGFILALILFLLLWPLYFIIAVAIAIESGTPVLYKPLRGGYKQKPFHIYKFRSMVKNADKIGGGTTALHDPRITKVGNFLRKTKLDEIPQLLNVFLGDMALIGPRPDSAFYLEHYTPEERVILTVRPGITGWNQAINRNSVGTKEKLQADIYYVEHLSFLFDLKVLWLTFKTVLSHKDVYRA